MRSSSSCRMAHETCGQKDLCALPRYNRNRRCGKMLGSPPKETGACVFLGNFQSQAWSGKVTNTVSLVAVWLYLRDLYTIQCHSQPSHTGAQCNLLHSNLPHPPTPSSALLPPFKRMIQPPSTPSHLPSCKFGINSLVAAAVVLLMLLNPAEGQSRLHKVSVVGSGNFGSAVARILGRNVLQQPEHFEPEVRMWVFEEELADGRKLSEVINAEHENVKYLPGVPLPSNVRAVPDLEVAARDASIIIMVVPHQHCTACKFCILGVGWERGKGGCPGGLKSRLPRM